MGRILSSRITEDNNVVFEVMTNYEEALQLKGRVNDICLFAQDESDIKANISLRGKNEATKYFLIPKVLRKDLKFNTKVTCQRMDTNTKNIFIYLVDRFKLD